MTPGQVRLIRRFHEQTIRAWLTDFPLAIPSCGTVVDHLMPSNTQPERPYASNIYTLRNRSCTPPFLVTSAVLEHKKWTCVGSRSSGNFRHPLAASSIGKQDLFPPKHPRLFQPLITQESHVRPTHSGVCASPSHLPRTILGNAQGKLGHVDQYHVQSDY